MRLRRFLGLLAREGFAGLRQRFRPRPPFGPTRPGRDLASLIARARQEYFRQRAEFQARVGDLNLAQEVHDFYWYHTIDLGNGLITPGDYDYRACLDQYQFPADLGGMSVLDVGSATGFFAFELERRGAQVLSVELPSLADWDMVSRERESIVRGIMERYHARTPEEAYHRVLDGPFQFCRRMLGSRVQRCYHTVYDLAPATVGAAGFDLIFLGDVFVHLLSPLKALDILATLCRQRLILALDLTDAVSQQPQLRYVGRDDGSGENRSWWVPNFSCVEKMLRTVGFRQVELAGQFSGILRRCGEPFHRSVVHAWK